MAQRNSFQCQSAIPHLCNPPTKKKNRRFICGKLSNHLSFWINWCDCYRSENPRNHILMKLVQVEYLKIFLKGEEEELLKIDDLLLHPDEYL